MRDWVDQRIKVESWQIRILSLDEYNIRSVVPTRKARVNHSSALDQIYMGFLLSNCYIPGVLPGQVDMVWKVVIQVRKSNLVFSTNRLTDDDLINIIEFIPVFIPRTGNRISSLAPLLDKNLKDKN